MKTVSLHHHTTFSYMDGIKTPYDHAARTAELGMTAQAVTEHGNVSSHVGHEKACTKLGLKPIFGLEAYTHPEPNSPRKFHLTLLAMNQVGYANLMRIVTRSWAEGFYRWPTVSGQMLADHHEGLICLSGCSDSLLACSLLGGKTITPAASSFKLAQRVATNFRALFGDRYYLECQAFPELDRSNHINEAYERLSRLTCIPLVGTFDVHYPLPDDNDLQLLIHAAGRGMNTAAQQAEGWEYDVRLTHPLSDKLALKRLRGGLSKDAASFALAMTGEIADRCNVVLPKAERLRYPLPPGKADSVELVWQWLRRGWRYRVKHGNKRMKKLKPEYIVRLNEEMQLIVERNFVDYFLMISDVVRAAKDAGEPVGPARGSAAASLVCYLLRITEIDPLQYPLMRFDRFIAPDRLDEPDIDLDFDDDLRGNTRVRLVEKYGEDRVANIGTFTKFKGRNSIDDIARVHEIPHAVAKLVKGMIIERSWGDSRADATIGDTIGMFPEVAAAFAQYPQLNMATRLEGSYRGMSTHAAGLVVTNGPISDYCAIYTRDAPGEAGKHGEKLTAVSVNKYDAEYLGLMKADFLGLSTMGMIRIALQHAGLTLEQLYRVPMTDEATVDAFRHHDVIGIFQFEGRATRLVCREVKPDNFQEIVDTNGLSRPGPLFSGTTAEYIRAKWGEKSASLHPIVDSYTAATKGQIIYQEQVLGILRVMGGLPVQRVHHIRRIISLKLGESEFNKSADDFAEGAAKLHGISDVLARKIWAKLVTSATYSFNIAHCVSYGMLAFWCMWLKVHHTTSFYLAQLRKSPPDGWSLLVRDAQRHGQVVRGVTLGKSGMEWEAPEPGLIVAGYEQLMGIGPAKARAIVRTEAALKADSGIGFQRPEDLLRVAGIGPKIFAGCRSQIGDADPFGIQAVADDIRKVRAWICDHPDLPQPGASSDALLDLSGVRVVFLGLVIERSYQDYIENERARSGRAVEDILRDMRHPGLAKSVTLRCVDDGEEDVYLRISRYTFPELKAAIDSLDVGKDMVVATGRRSDRSATFGVSIQVKSLIVISPDD